jgi:hypothetical protein
MLSARCSVDYFPLFIMKLLRPAVFKFCAERIAEASKNKTHRSTYHETLPNVLPLLKTPSIGRRSDRS